MNEIKIEQELNSKRCSHVFKEHGSSFDINGLIFVDPDGGAYTCSASHLPVSFPYTPKRLYQKVDCDGKPIGVPTESL